MKKILISAIKILRKSKVYKFLRVSMFSLFLAGIGLYAFLYLIISLPIVQNSLRDIAESELSNLLGAKVEIGKLYIKPFKQFVAQNVDLIIENADSIKPKKALSVREIGAGLSLYQLAVNRKMVFTYAELLGTKVHLWRDSAGAQLNIEPIIANLRKPKSDNKTKFDFKIYNVVIRQGVLTYDVLNKAKKENRFDVNHVYVGNFTADVIIPRLSDKELKVWVKRLMMKEHSGMFLKDFTAQISLCDSLISVRGLQLDFPNSHLEFDDFEERIESLDGIKNNLDSVAVNINTRNSYVGVSDFSPFLPVLSNFNNKFDFNLHTSGSVNNLRIDRFEIGERSGDFDLQITADVKNVTKANDAEVLVEKVNMRIRQGLLSNILNAFEKVSHETKSGILSLGDVSLNASGKISAIHNVVKGNVKSDVGNLNFDGIINRDTTSQVLRLTANINTNGINTSELLPRGKYNLDYIGMDMKAKVSVKNQKLLGFDVKALVTDATVNGYKYQDLTLNAFGQSDKKYEASIVLNDKNAVIDFIGGFDIDNKKDYTASARLKVENLNFNALALTDKYRGYSLSFDMHTDVSGASIDDITGNFVVDNIRFVDKKGKGIYSDHFSIYAFGDNLPKSIIVDSDMLQANISGDYHFKSIPWTIKNSIAEVFPSLTPLILNNKERPKTIENNAFTYEIALNPDKEVYDVFNIPVRLMQPVRLSGNVDGNSSFYSLYTEIPYLLQKNKLIENSRLSFVINGAKHYADLSLNTSFPAKRGMVDLSMSLNGVKDALYSNVGWKVNVAKDFYGNVEAKTSFDVVDDILTASVNVMKSDLIFNDTTWLLKPAKIDVVGKSLMIDGFEARCDKQFVKIDGNISPDPDDQLFVNLHDINLDFVFETLEIPNVTFGGKGTGEFWASNLFGKIPTLATERFYVEDLSYNGCVLGNTNIASRWNNETMGIELNAKIAQHNGENSYVDGSIFPSKDSLYLEFKVKHTPVEFLLPYMEAFTSYVSGTASGNGTLFGNFKTINFKGDLMAEDFKLKIDYLNTIYSCTDSVHILPDYISLDGITINDKFGNTARLAGCVRHNAFHDASIDIGILQANNLLCYDITSAMSPQWYGTIFGSGNAFVKGEPGVVNIDVNMTSAYGSSFTYVMKGNEAANDFNFITFTDRNRSLIIEGIDSVPESVKAIKRGQKKEEDGTSVLNVNVQAEINPDMNITLVMDPAGGDKIRATGRGNMSMGYNSTDNDFYMRGKYTLNKGAYNFTLQDIIIKDFTINEGSSITFQGSPGDAVMDITAVYQLNASLTDLDDSFALDKDLNRTNVPVQAVLQAKGDIEQPSIKFDLNFPTLSEEAYRKVKSIVSTDDMMNRQILYLVALNRFYTPEYMSATTNSNEFANVASSTISSQLSNILGQISDNWSIAPNFRTNKGDFSDMEVDVALSSQLLNNRLLLNGNFGYRDNSMNNSSTNFIGDFDIEYLLTRGGNVRLKAYNYYNDQNYYIKSALTTQGVGIVFKFDFDNPFDVIRDIKLPKIFKSRFDK
ncbi:MAG: translocation/assembly module TamB domain-containing protein [Muribaculaceae bacterium]|nr:translocation/assembly module TamB domain-containing protein [Muribaculaceae bacterium]